MTLKYHNILIYIELLFIPTINKYNSKDLVPMLDECEYFCFIGKLVYKLHETKNTPSQTIFNYANHV